VSPLEAAPVVPVEAQEPCVEPPPLPEESLAEEERKAAEPIEETAAEPEEFIPEDEVLVQEPPPFDQAPPIPSEADEDEEPVQRKVPKPHIESQASKTKLFSNMAANAKRIKGVPVWLPVALVLFFIVVIGGSLLWYLNRETPEQAPAPKPATIESTVPVEPAKVVAEPAKVVEPVPAVPATEPVPVAAAVPPKEAPVITGIAAKLLCPPDMAKIVTNAVAEDKPDLDPSTVAFCIDAYEFPGKGQKPKGGVSAAAARRSCKDAGKRLCEISEWKMACGEAYSYGEAYKAGVCNVGTGRMRPAGEMPGCKTADGVFDMVGNMSEWADDGFAHGGDAGGGSGTTCGSKSKRFMPSATNGFRCCANPSR